MPGERLDVIVPGSEVGVAQGPVDADALPEVRLEVEIAPAVALAAPKQRASADVVAAEPGVGLHLHVRRFPVVHEKGRVVLAHLVDVVAGAQGRRHPVAVGKFPGGLERVHVTGDVLDVFAPLEEEHLEAIFRQLLGGPAAADPRADDDRVVGGSAMVSLRVRGQRAHADRELGAGLLSTALAAEEPDGSGWASDGFITQIGRPPRVSCQGHCRGLCLLPRCRDGLQIHGP